VCGCVDCPVCVNTDAGASHDKVTNLKLMDIDGWVWMGMPVSVNTNTGALHDNVHNLDLKLMDVDRYARTHEYGCGSVNHF